MDSMKENPIDKDAFFSDLTPNARERLKRVVLHYRQSLCALLMFHPVSVSRLLTKSNDLPSLFMLKAVLEDPRLPGKAHSFLSYVSGILFALNCLERDTGVLLYRHLFIQRDCDEWMKSLSHSSFYRISGKAIHTFFQILDGPEPKPLNKQESEGQ